MLVVVTGELSGETKVEKNNKIIHHSKRTIFAGGTINVLCVLKLWSKCIETVIALNPVETYAVTAEDFVALFKGSNDDGLFQTLQIKESFNFNMDRSQISPNAPLGQPM